MMTVQSAHAIWIRCRSDPLVILSNGMVLDLSADINTWLWNVEEVDYVLHVPAGVSLVASIGTPTWLTSQETFTLYADSPPGEYHTETIVHTTQGSVAVTAHTILISALGIHLDSGSASGLVDQILHVYMNVP
ncbi:MAG: hypothetical protein L0322_01050 [Chloroflexi bacterium]|nr:hypothetical protein [Chloroflexota bacterium]MCI0577429.1 hypothetical protein [Chloroflexota bacterium]MCI0649485.1 hypothetical protein [Chloroflexota bacterium]